MDFAYLLSCISKGLRQQPAQQACFGVNCIYHRMCPRKKNTTSGLFDDDIAWILDTWGQTVVTPPSLEAPRDGGRAQHLETQEGHKAPSLRSRCRVISYFDTSPSGYLVSSISRPDKLGI